MKCGQHYLPINPRPMQRGMVIHGRVCAAIKLLMLRMPLILMPMLLFMPLMLLMLLILLVLLVLLVLLMLLMLPMMLFMLPDGRRRRLTPSPKQKENRND